MTAKIWSLLTWKPCPHAHRYHQARCLISAWLEHDQLWLINKKPP